MRERERLLGFFKRMSLFVTDLEIVRQISWRNKRMKEEMKEEKRNAASYCPNIKLLIKSLIKFVKSYFFDQIIYNYLLNFRN